MWVEFDIADKKYYLLCSTNDTDEVDCVLYNGQESWHEGLSVSVMLKRAREFNKRIQFDEVTIKETLFNAQPTEANWLDGDGDCNECTLKLKYRVKACPLIFTWYFSKQTEHDQFILFPLFRIVQGLTQQNEELREVVRKKDVEIKQYKFQGAVLKRVTVATPTFIFSDFDEKYADTIALSKNIMQISDLLKAQYTPLQTPLKVTNNVQDDQQKESDVKLTPRRKRRKILEEQQRVIAEKLKARGKPMAYESSQSEPLTSSSPEILPPEKPKTAEIPLVKKSDEDIPIIVREPANETTLPSPSKCLRVRKEAVRSSTEERPLLRKRKPTTYIEYDNSQSSSEEDKDKTLKPDAKKANILKTDSHSPLNSTLEHNSDDIKSIIDDWKALEQRRVADLNNTRTTRTGKRISS